MILNKCEDFKIYQRKNFEYIEEKTKLNIKKEAEETLPLFMGGFEYGF